MAAHFSLHPLEFDKIREYLRRYVLTDMSSERLEVLAPSTDFHQIEKNLDELTEMADLLKFDDAFPIEKIKDIRGSLKKLHTLGIFLNPESLTHILTTLQTSRRIQSYIRNRKEKYPLLLKRISVLQSYPDVEHSISAAVDDNGEIKNNASPKLRQIRRDIETKSSAIRKKLELLSKQFASEGYAQDAIVTMRGGRMVIPIKEEYKHIVKGFIHDESSSGQTVFIEPAEGLELNNELRKLSLDETREIERILLEIADSMRPHLSSLEQETDILGDVEFLYVKGRFANLINGIKPHLNNTGHIQVKKGYHPLLLLKEQIKLPDERRPVVPLNMELGNPPHCGRTLIISGPNAGGKTVALKTIGLFSLMIQSGLLVPCEYGSRFSTFDQVFADIGDDQSIENDLSTFSSHIRHLSDMVSMVNSRTLILIDEIGSGTDPKEGSSLAIAILEHFNQKKAVTIVTTHHGELKAFAHNTAGVENGSMEFDQDTLEPTYIFRPKIPGSSYAFEISRRIGLSGYIIDKAKELAGKETQNMENLIQELQSQSKRYEVLISDTHRKQAEMDGLNSLYQQRLKELKDKERNLKKHVLEENQKYFHDARQKLESLIREIRASQADKDTVKTAKDLLREQSSHLQSELNGLRQNETVPLESPDQLRKGTKVYIPFMDVEGTVMEEPDLSGQVVIGVGTMSVRLGTGQLSKSRSPVEKQTETLPRQYIEWNTDDVRQQIDLRGLTADEAIHKVDSYLSDVQVLGFKEVTLVHGKGDGILRKRIGEFLKRDVRVKHFRLGQWGEGDTGVTVVEVKSE